jgi:hypothetical protein
MNTPFNVSWSKDVKKSQNKSAGWLASEALKAKAKEFCLGQGEMLHFDGDQRGTVFHTLFGKVWLTQEGDPEDYMLLPGNEFAVSRRGRVVVEATQETLLRIIPVR